ncbi:MAG: hypothetical protein J6J74_06055 [Elusimicrobiaceae bacterium]|nr:hypothetical protein [Elusimicrobiaceae bacterium]
MITNEQKQILKEQIVYYTAQAQAYNTAAVYLPNNSKTRKKFLELSEELSDLAFKLADDFRLIGRSSSTKINILDHLDWSISQREVK